MSLATPAAPAQVAASRPSVRAVSGAAATVEPLARLDRSVAHKLGADLRLLYGLAAPVLLVIAVMIPMFLHATYVMVGGVMVVELACLGLVIHQILAVLGEAPEGEEPPLH